MDMEATLSGDAGVEDPGLGDMAPAPDAFGVAAESMLSAMLEAIWAGIDIARGVFAPVKSLVGEMDEAAGDTLATARAGPGPRELLRVLPTLEDRLGPMSGPPGVPGVRAGTLLMRAAP